MPDINQFKLALPTGHSFAPTELETLEKADQEGILGHVLRVYPELAAKVRGVLDDPTAQALLGDAHRQWLGLLPPKSNGHLTGSGLFEVVVADGHVPSLVAEIMLAELAPQIANLEQSGNLREAARLAMRLTWILLDAKLEEDVTRDLTEDPLQYFRPGSKPINITLTRAEQHAKNLLGDLAGRENLGQTPAYTTTLEKLQSILGEMLEGRFDSARNQLETMRQSNEPLTASHFGIALDLYKIAMHQQEFLRLGEQGEHAKAVAHAILFVNHSHYLAEHGYEFEMTTPEDPAFYAVVPHAVDTIVGSLFEHGKYPGVTDWHNFFKFYSHSMAKTAHVSGPQKAIAAYWDLRFGYLFYYLTGRKKSYTLEQVDKLDQLLPQIRAAVQTAGYPQEYLIDAIRFRKSMEQNALYGTRVELFSPPPPNPLPRGEGERKEWTPAIKHSPDIQQKIEETGRRVIELGTMDWKQPTTWGRLAKKWWNPLHWVQNIVNGRLDTVNKVLAPHKDLLNAAMRFADVLPQIEQNDAEVVRHFREYFPQTDARLPFYMNWAIRYAHSNGASLKLQAWVLRQGVHRMAERYIAGEDVKDARGPIYRMFKEGKGVIFDAMGEAITSEAEANAYQKTYRDFIADITADKKLLRLARKNNARPSTVPKFAEHYQTDAQMAIKLSGLVPSTQWNAADPEGTSAAVKARLRPILDDLIAAEKAGVRIRLTIDPEEFEFRDLTNQILREVLMEDAYVGMENVGMAVQLYLLDSLGQIEDWATWSEARAARAAALGLTNLGHAGQSIAIRPVKGAYWDQEYLRTQQHGYPRPTFTEKWLSDVNYELGLDLLFKHHKHLRASVASHNIRSLSYAITEARRLKIPMEVQMLYGMAPETEAALVAMGIPVWMYTPIGKLLPSMAYLARRILENSSQSSFLLQRLLGVDIKQLLKNPAEGHDVSEWPPRSQLVQIAKTITDLNQEFTNEPLTDFSQETNRAAVREALDNLTNFFKDNSAESSFISVPAVIDGADYSYSAESFVARNPSNPLEILGTVANSREGEVPDAVQAARDHFADWRDQPAAVQNLGDVGDAHAKRIVQVTARAELLLKAAQIMREERAQLTALIMKEAGKPLKEADADVAEAIDFLEYYARLGIKMVTENPDMLLDPKGVAAIIPPWNFPLAIAAGMTASALVMGNTVVLKPAEQTSLIGHRLVNILHRAGIAKGVVNYVPGDRETGKLLRQQNIDLVAFTGSKKAGLEIYAEDAAKGVKVIAEMGGKNALIVSRDAHPDEVIKTVLYGKFGYAGQKCSAIDRLIIVGDEEHYWSILNRLVAAAKSLRVGDVADFGNFMGPVIDQAAYHRLIMLIVNAVTERQGELLLSGLDHPAYDPKGGNYFIGPTIFHVTNPRVALMQNENFGPILAAMRADTLEEAVKIAELSLFGLTGGFLGRSPEDIKWIIDHWEQVGNLYINRNQVGAAVGRNPFGGDKHSGIAGSKAGGEEYPWQFVNVKSAAEDRVQDAQKVFNEVAERTHKKLTTPVEYQPALPGESNQVVFRPRGLGWIVLNADTTLAQAAGLVSAAIFAGNDIIITRPNEMLDFDQNLLKLIQFHPDLKFVKEQGTGFQHDVYQYPIPANQVGHIRNLKTNKTTQIIFVDPPSIYPIILRGGEGWGEPWREGDWEKGLGIYSRGKGKHGKVIVKEGWGPRVQAKQDLARHKDVKWIAFPDKSQIDLGILKPAVETLAGQNFVRTVIAGDPTINDPNIFAGMTIPRTVTENTALHGFDAKQASNPPPSDNTPKKSSPSLDGRGLGEGETGGSELASPDDTSALHAGGMQFVGSPGLGVAKPALLRAVFR